MISVAVIGAKGFVGSSICKSLKRKSDINLIEVTRSDNLLAKIKTADIIIHAANSAKRFFAEKNPEKDFEESVNKTHEILKAAGDKKVILISSISARTQLYNVYGRHRRACEMLCDSSRNLIVRLGPMYGQNKSLGALSDIMANRPVYLDGETKYAYVPVEYNANRICSMLESSGLVELGAKNCISLHELALSLQSSSTFEGIRDDQFPLAINESAPDAFDVVQYAKALLGKS